MEKCIELNEPIIVLEDDIEILLEFWQKLQTTIQSKYTYVRLMYLKTKFSLSPLEYLILPKNILDNVLSKLEKTT